MTVFPCCDRTSDPAVGGSVCVDAESADGDRKRPSYVRTYFGILTQFALEPFRTKGMKNESIFVFFSQVQLQT